MNTDHILNVEDSTDVFSDIPRALAHYFQTDSILAKNHFR